MEQAEPLRIDLVNSMRKHCRTDATDMLASLYIKESRPVAFATLSMAFVGLEEAAAVDDTMAKMAWQFIRVSQPTQTLSIMPALAVLDEPSELSPKMAALLFCSGCLNDMAFFPLKIA